MLKEEKELYDWIRGAQDVRPFNVLVKNLIRAVRLDEQLRNQCGCDVCAAIRRKKEK